MSDQTLEEMMYDIKIDLARVKTDVVWLKKLFVTGIIAIGVVFGVDLTGVVV